ncbi:hypothetical protein [uncultured Methanobrevibacter sp.]|uniref:hypothetical protein n=1 Tax=uncultured Methanobrevibacter sp. TaxID=253161 RepID=UPI0025E886F7|nr:hypothetical protein [uncultured Methanobrevibacter sp.]
MKAVKIIAFLCFVFIIFASASNVFAADENNIDSVHAENNTISAGDSSVNGNPMMLNICLEEILILPVPIFL